MTKSFFQKLLNVRPTEWKAVTQLFWLQFFQGTGIAFFFTASFFNFIKKFHATELAWVLIASAPLLGFTGLIFSKLEPKLNMRKLGTGAIILMSASILLFQLIGHRQNADWFYYLMFAWYYVLYLASNLLFWGITSTLYDVRQSKRLFSVISAGDIPAKFIGYTLAYFFVTTIGPLNMLYPAFVFMIFSLPFLIQISHNEALHHHHHHSENDVEYFQGKGIWVVIKRFTLNVLIRQMAILTFLISCCLAIINYAFYTKVKEASHDDESLSRFIILFMAGSQLFAMLIKLVFTSRIVTSLGVKRSLLITPLVLMLLLVIVLFTEKVFGEDVLLFYAFGIAAISIEILRTAISNPVFLTVMQPLNPTARAKAHGIVKGIMDPFAFLFTGIMLIALQQLERGSDLVILCYILLLFAAGWIISIVMVNQSYTLTLLKTISSRFFSQDDFQLSNEEIQKQILKKIETGNESEVINIMQMLNTQLSEESKQFIYKLLDHPSDEVKTETIRLIKSRHLKGAEEKLYQLAKDSGNEEVRFQAVQTLCKEEHEIFYQQHFIHHPDSPIRVAALSGMLMCRQQKIHKQAEDIISQMIQSNNLDEKKLGLQILDQVKDSYCHPLYSSFFNESEELKMEAIRSIGKAAHPELFTHLIGHLSVKPGLILDTMARCGENAIPAISSFLHSNPNQNHVSEKLIVLLGKIGGTKAQDVLLHLLKQPETNTPVIIKALHRSRYKCTQSTTEMFEEIATAYLTYGVELLAMQKKLEPDNQEYFVLINSLNLELLEIRDVLIYLFGCLYDYEKAYKIKQGLDMKKRESIANAMEVLEVTVKKEMAQPFTLLYETTEIDHRYSSLKNLLPPLYLQQAIDVLSRILSEKPITYSNWTKASSLYISKKYNIKLNPELIKKFKHSENKLLQETALYAE